VVINFKDNDKKGVNKGDNAVNSGTDVNKDNKDDNNLKDKKKKMSLIAVGDVLIHESVYKDAFQPNSDKYDFSKMFTDVEPIIKKYDLKFCNQESTIGGSALGISGYPSFNAPDEIGDEIVRLGFNLISLANNHAMDKGKDAILYSNSYWKTKDVITAGSYSNSDERNKVNIYEKNGIKYAFLAYTTSLNGNNLPNDYLVNMYSNTKVKNDIEAVKDKVDVIIVSMHWGEEYTNTPTSSEKEIAKAQAQAKKEANDAQVSSELEIANAIAKAQKEKAVVQAEADRESKEAQIGAETLIAQKENDLAIRKAELQKDADTKKAIADAAYQIQQETERKTVEVATADANLARQEKAIALKEKEVELTERTLEATVKKQADGVNLR